MIDYCTGFLLVKNKLYRCGRSVIIMSMLDQKKSLMLGVVIFISIILIIIFMLVLGGSDSDQKDSDSDVSSDVSTDVLVEQGEEVPDGLVQIIDTDSILRSDNSGLDFTPYFKISTNGEIGLADVLSVTFHPKEEGNVTVTSVLDGLFNKKAESETWTPIVFPPKNIYSFILDKKDPDNRMFAAGVISGNGRVFRTDDGGDNWRAVYAEPGPKTTVTALSQRSRNTDVIFAGTSVGTLIKSLDGGSTWKNLGNEISGTIKNISFDSNRALAAYLLALKKAVYYSPDDGITWIDWEKEKPKEVSALKDLANISRKEGNISTYERLKAEAEILAERNKKDKRPSGILLIVTDPNISGVLYAGTSQGLYRSDSYGKYWTGLNIVESASKYPISSIAINPNDSDEIVFVSGKSFYKTKNNGETWSVTPLSADRSASFVAYDPFNVETIFIGLSSR